jgi:hypothetical protein
MNLCFFKDPLHATPFQKVGSEQPVNLEHRKVIAYRYRTSSGNTIDEEGHGSHTSGSIVANALSGADQQFNGMAPDAKLVLKCTHFTSTTVHILTQKALLDLRRHLC